jgi:hypothetical protein
LKVLLKKRKYWPWFESSFEKKENTGHGLKVLLKKKENTGHIQSNGGGFYFFYFANSSVLMHCNIFKGSSSVL